MQEDNQENVAVDLTEEDKQNMRIFLKALYHTGPSVVDNWQMNETVFLIIKEILGKGVTCSDWIEWVPQPGDLIGAKGIRTAKEVLRKIAKRVAKDQVQDKLGNRQRMKFVCQNSLIYGYRTRLDDAGSGGY